MAKSSFNRVWHIGLIGGGQSTPPSSLNPSGSRQNKRIIIIKLKTLTSAALLAVMATTASAFELEPGNGWVFANTGGGWEYPAFWAVAQTVQAMLGDGAYALKLPKLPRANALA